MPGSQELVGLLVVILIAWFVLKLAKVAIRLILLFIAVVVIIGAFLWLFAR